MTRSHRSRGSPRHLYARLAHTTLFACAVLVVSASSSALAQATGTIRGTVVEASTGQPLADVQLSVIGTRRGAVTGENGRYVITQAPIGALTLRAQKLGFGAQQSLVRIAGNDSATVDFRMSTVAVALDQIVVTGTPGATEKRVLGNTVATVDAVLNYSKTRLRSERDGNAYSQSRRVHAVDVIA